MKTYTRTQATVTAKEIMNRLAPLRKASPNSPKGIPRTKSNDTNTQALYPTDHNMPRDTGFDFRSMISGSGSGPIL